MLTLLLNLSEVYSSIGLSNSLIIYCDNTDLVPWGKELCSNVGYPRFGNLVSSMIELPPHIKGLIVGLILGDAGLSIANKTNGNARLCFSQSLSHFRYFWSVFIKLAHYCSSFPYLRVGKRLGVLTYSPRLQTRSLPVFTELYNLFYIKGVKVIPVEHIFEILTPIALAHWISCDGSAQRSGLELCTDSYTLQEVILLMNVLMVKYQLDCTLRYHRSTQQYPRIYIRANSMARLRDIVSPHMEESIYYKVKT